MTTDQIQHIISKNINPFLIQESLITICPYNKQIEQISIIFKPEAYPDYTKLGNIIQQLDNLTIKDNYGDITHLQLTIDHHHYLPNDDLTLAIHFKINIDS